jgi:predicted DNA-binding protein with PD1-like motif
MTSEVVGRMGRVYMTRLGKNEDLLQAIYGVVRRSGMKAGVVLSITGALTHAVLQKFMKGEKAIGVTEFDGDMEVSGHGIVGWVSAPERGKEPFGVGRYVNGEPYAHVHLTVTTADQTLCGHLMEGCRVRSNHAISHFTIMIAELEGAELRMRSDPDHPGGLYHELVELPKGNA